jgi:hypothetical protein
MGRADPTDRRRIALDRITKTRTHISNIGAFYANFLERALRIAGLSEVKNRSLAAARRLAATLLSRSFSFKPRSIL